MNWKHLLVGFAAAAMTTAPATAERGSDGQLNIIYWQAVSILNPFLSGGTKDLESASLVVEPLARYDENGDLVPYLAAEIPTIENGGVAADFRSITWKLRPDIVWSDGTPLTAEDAAFTAGYCMNPTMGCSQLTNFNGVESVEAVDDHTIRITFVDAKPFPYGPFVGAASPILQKAQFEGCQGAEAQQCTEQNFHPIGTGPFRVADFKANDVVVFEANPNYRDPAKPAFGTVVFKGGGDSASAVRSVLETGEFHYAWNAQVEPEILAQMMQAGKGRIISAFGTLVERLVINLTNPDPGLGDARSTRAGGPHPFLTDGAVTRALSLAIDREILVEAGYGAAGQVTCNILPAPAIYASPNNEGCRTQDIAEANRILDEAGWGRGSDGIREKDGVRLSILYQNLDQFGATGDAGADQAVVARDRRRDRAAQHRRRRVLRRRPRQPRTPTRSSTPISKCTRTTSTGRTRNRTWRIGPARKSPRLRTSGRAATFRAIAIRDTTN